MNAPILNCAQVDGLLAGYLEEELDLPARRLIDLHVASCAECSALVRDLRAIAAEASALPELVPSRDLWAGIEARIDDVVVTPLGTRDERRAPSRSGTSAERRAPRWLAAAGLVVATAGITYYATTRGGSVASVPVAAAPASVSTDSPTVTTVPPAATLPFPGAGTATVRTVRRTREPAVVTYDAEIARLRGTLNERRNDLDPATVAILEHSLKTINQAITEARGALSRDPASGFLQEQLNKALEKKLGVLRTAALLRT